jgi:hypothetical protein
MKTASNCATMYPRQELYFLLSLISFIEIPKQRDINRAPTSLKPLLDHDNSSEKIPFRLLLLENQT